MSVDSVPVGKPRRRGVALVGLIVALVAVVVMIDGVWDRKSSAARLKEDISTASASDQIPVVAVVQPKVAAGADRLDLPGRTEAYIRAPIYARVGGFLKGWYVDIGTPVKAGQLLAEIEAPDLDQQLMQARGALASAEATEALAKVTAQRWSTLGQTNTLSKQAVDEKTGDLSVKEANTKAAKASVDRLEVLAAFKRVTAPFDGVVTTRNTDVGALINADSSAGLALFVISDTRKLRLNINVPQANVPAVKLGSKVDITVPEYPGKVFSGVVEASARSVDPVSGTTRIQVVIDNSEGKLMPGAFANARVPLPASSQALAIPAGALIFGQKGLRVAVLDGDNKVNLKKVSIARDLGQTVEIATGLGPGDRVIDSPPDGLSDGDPVRVASGSTPKK